MRGALMADRHHGWHGAALARASSGELPSRTDHCKCEWLVRRRFDAVPLRSRLGKCRNRDVVSA
jgi:hypothetical protein